MCVRDVCVCVCVCIAMCGEKCEPIAQRIGRTPSRYTQAASDATQINDQNLGLRARVPNCVTNFPAITGVLPTSFDTYHVHLDTFEVAKVSM